MAINKGMFSSKSDEWTTPRDLFDRLNRRFLFDLDAAATDENHLCDKYFTKATNGLDQSWEGRRVFVNPPYSRIKDWALKFCLEGVRADCIVALVPARTDTRWFQGIMANADKIVFIKGASSLAPAQAPRPSPRHSPSGWGCTNSKNFREAVSRNWGIASVGGSFCLPSTEA